MMRTTCYHYVCVRGQKYIGLWAAMTDWLRIFCRCCENERDTVTICDKDSWAWCLKTKISWQVKICVKSARGTLLQSGCSYKEGFKSAPGPSWLRHNTRFCLKIVSFPGKPARFSYHSIIFLNKLCCFGSSPQQGRSSSSIALRNCSGSMQTWPHHR